MILIKKWIARVRQPAAAEILDEMLGELQDLNRSRRHIYGLRNTLAPFTKEFPRLERVERVDVVEYLRARLIGPRRRDNILSAIVQLSRFARSHGYLSEDRRSAAEKVGKIKPGYDVQTWTPAEALLILEHVSPHWLPYVALGLFAGLRSSEILRLQWSAIKWDLLDGDGKPAPAIALSGKVARKIRRSRLVPMQPNLITWLAPYRDCVGPLYLGAFKTNENAHSREMSRIRRLTGLPRKDNALRHSFGSYRLAVLANYERVAGEMGNSPRMIRESYNDPKPIGEGIAYFRISRPEFQNVVPMSLDLEFV